MKQPPPGQFAPVDCNGHHPGHGKPCAGHKRYVGGGTMDGTVTHMPLAHPSDFPSTMGTIARAGQRSHYRRDDSASPAPTDVIYRFVGLARNYPGDPADHKMGPPPGVKP